MFEKSACRFHWARKNLYLLKSKWHYDANGGRSCKSWGVAVAHPRLNRLRKEFLKSSNKPDRLAYLPHFKKLSLVIVLGSSIQWL